MNLPRELLDAALAIADAIVNLELLTGRKPQLVSALCLVSMWMHFLLYLTKFGMASAQTLQIRNFPYDHGTRSIMMTAFDQSSPNPPVLLAAPGPFFLSKGISQHQDYCQAHGNWCDNDPQLSQVGVPKMGAGKATTSCKATISCNDHRKHRLIHSYSFTHPDTAKPRSSRGTSKTPVITATSPTYFGHDPALCDFGVFRTVVDARNGGEPPY